jgi:hypothetical protein
VQVIFLEDSYINITYQMLQSVKRNKDECLQLMENINQVLYAIVDLHIRSETVGALPPAILKDIGHFTAWS